MGRDRYVNWGEKAPTYSEVLATARDFFGPSAEEGSLGREWYEFSPIRSTVPRSWTCIHGRV
jgi:hypothetical protein